MGPERLTDVEDAHTDGPECPSYIGGHTLELYDGFASNGPRDGSDGSGGVTLA